MLLAAFAGGAFGAAIGALPAFTFAGFLVIAGETYAMLERNLGVSVEAAGLGSVAITESIALGVVFGPHVSFGGGAAAAAYAAKRGYLDTGFEYHEAKNVVQGLGTRPDVLLVGGVFGIVGYWIASASAALSAPWGPVAMGVVLSALCHRLVLGYSLIGATRGKLLDMRPFENGTARSSERGRDRRSATDGGRLLVEPWLPYQYKWANVTVLGAVVGILGAYIAYVTGSAFLAFGISVATLVYINAGVAKIPVTHHITLPASTAVLAVVGAPMGELTPELVAASISLGDALLLGAAFGVVGALAGEVTQRIFYAHADTHLDPPAASIVLTSFLIAVLAMAGVFASAVWIPHP
nr:hypothetical protein [Natronobiforma cellulositropha]